MLPYHFNRISFDEIAEIWKTKLWPGRSDIEQQSAMLYLGGHDMTNFNQATCYIEMTSGNWLETIGVNSIHMCADGSLRSRGLWVEPKWRGMGLGAELLKASLKQGWEAWHPSFAWSYPRKTSQKIYEAAGFKITSDWTKSDTSDANAFCRYDY